MKIYCKKHPSYKAVKQPKAECMACKMIYTYKNHKFGTLVVK